MKRRALLVGINRYKMQGNDLRGCLNDVTNVRDVVMKYFGFGVDEIRVLTDERATRQRIIEKLAWLVDGAKEGDRLLFHFSGHGSQVRDANGDELKDKMDEILCPHDMDWDGVYIRDDDLRMAFGSLPRGTNLEVILDCCHSGTGTRELVALGSLPPEIAFRPRFLPPPVDVDCTFDEDLPVRRLLVSRGGQAVAQHVLFAACGENQTAAEALLGGAYNGAFTYYLCKHIRDTHGEISRRELLRRVRASLKWGGFSQRPRLEAPDSEKGKNLFG